MSFTTLIEPADLTAGLTDPDWAIVDCRFALDDPAWGEREYAAAHVPGAVYAHLDRDLSGAKNGTNGRHPLPASATLAATLGRLGIDRDVQVVAYDQDAGMYAARLWWMLRWLGHDRVAVLDGGVARWTAEGRPLASGCERRVARVCAVSPRPAMSLDTDAIVARIGRPEWRLIDARAPERYRGEIETIDRVAGHIPGAVNYFYKQSVDERGVFRSKDELARLLQDALGGLPPDRVACYCGSGVTACHVLLALEHIGRRGTTMYPGSWSEWSSNPSRPVERAPQE